MIADHRSESGGEDVPERLETALQHRRCQRIVEHLHDADDELTLVTLASRLTDETDAPLPEVVRELHDVHLTRLTDRGVIEYDDETGVVSLTVPSEAVEEALD